MVKIKGILAVGVILLFLGLAFSPVTAQTTIKDQLEVSTIGNLAPVQVSEIGVDRGGTFRGRAGPSVSEARRADAAAGPSNRRVRSHRKRASP
jgi:hypothetical protein